MFDHHLLKQIERRIERLETLIEFLIIALGHRQHPPPIRFPPAAGRLTGTFASTYTSGVSMSSESLVAVLPTTRKDGSTLAATDIASITFQKTSLTGSPPVAGPLTPLQTNSAQPGAGLLPTDLTYIDSTAAPGDDYTFFVTDVQGHIGDASNDVIVPAIQAAPAAGTLTGTFTP